jgi:hypothetical protein
MRDSLLHRSLPLSAAAVLASAAVNGGNGFRPRDVRFNLELFSNWMEIDYHEGVLPVQNIQIGRFLGSLVSQGILVVNKSMKARTSYRLTRVGIIELVGMLLEDTEFGKRERFYFVFYFILSYRDIIISMINNDSQRYPHSLLIEVEDLLDLEDIIHKEIKATEQSIRKLESRISSAEKSSAVFEEELKKGESLDTTIKKFQHIFPYALNNIRPLVELISSLPEALQKKELGHGTIMRMEIIWKSHLRILEQHHALLGALKNIL